MNKTIEHLLQEAKILNIEILEVVLMAEPKSFIEVPEIIAHYGQVSLIPNELQMLINYNNQSSRKQVFTFSDIEFICIYDTDERIFADLSGETGLFIKELQGKILFGMFELCSIGEIRLLLSNCE